MEASCYQREFEVNNSGRCFFINGLSGFPTSFKEHQIPLSIQDLSIKQQHSAFLCRTVEELIDLTFTSREILPKLSVQSGLELPQIMQGFLKWPDYIGSRSHLFICAEECLLLAI